MALPPAMVKPRKRGRQGKRPLWHDQRTAFTIIVQQVVALVANAGARAGDHLLGRVQSPRPRLVRVTHNVHAAGVADKPRHGRLRNDRVGQRLDPIHTCSRYEEGAHRRKKGRGRANEGRKSEERRTGEREREEAKEEKEGTGVEHQMIGRTKGWRDKSSCQQQSMARQ